MSQVPNRSFAAGEIAPAIYSRPDIVKYSTGLRTCRNFQVQRHGGVANRAGTTYVGATPAGANNVRLIPFIFNDDQTYVLEFTAGKIRVIQNGGYVTSSTLSASDFTYGTVVDYTNTQYPETGLPNKHYKEITMASTAGFIVGDNVWVRETGSGSPSEDARVAVVVSGTVLRLLPNPPGNVYFNGLPITYPSGGTGPGGKLVKQQAYVTVTLASTTSFSPGDTAFISNTDGTNNIEYSVSAVPNGTTIRVTNLNGSAPVPTSLTASAVPKLVTKNFRINNTYTEDEIFELQYVQSADVITIVHHNHKPAELKRLANDNWTLTDITFAPLVAAPTGLTITTGDTAGSDYVYRVTAIDDITGEESYASGAVDTGTTPASGSPVVLQWTQQAGSSYYNVYKQANNSGTYGFIGQGRGNGSNGTFTDKGVDPDYLTSFSYAPDQDFSTTGNYPSAVFYTQQRLGFAATDNQPETIWLSRTGNFHNFSKSPTIQDDSSFTFNLAGRQVNQVKHLLDLGTPVVFTSGGEWVLQGDGAGVVSAKTINARQQTYNGSNELGPIVIEGNALYVQARGSRVRDYAFSFESSGYRGNDLTIFSAHLFDDHSLVDWTYQQIPQSIVWLVRDDGILLGLTYVREQEIFGWHRHDFLDASAESVCAVPEGSEDFLYLVINRDGLKSVERMNSRYISDVKDMIFMDGALTYDGRNTNQSLTMTISGGAYTSDDTQTLTASAAFFSASDVGNEIHLYPAEGGTIRLSITAYTSTTVVTVSPSMNVPASLQAIASNNWAKAVDQLSGLSHLEGRSVSVLGDGFVVANPNVETYDVVSVSAGAITLADCYSVIHVGVPITADLETLDVDQPSGETLANKSKLVSRVNVWLQASRGLFVGSSAPENDVTNEDDDILFGLTEYKVRQDEDYDDPVRLVTDVVSVNIRPEWNKSGRIFIRQTDPLPLTINAVAPAGLVPYKSNRGSNN